jgi:hypothetical protein
LQRYEIEKQDVTKTAFWASQMGKILNDFSQNFGKLLTSGFSAEGFKNIANTIKEGFKLILVAIIDSLSNMLYAGTIQTLIESIFNPLITIKNAGTLLAGKIGLEILKGAVMAMATGGIVKKPTLVMAGEAGSEMFAPERDFRQEIKNIIAEERRNFPAIQQAQQKVIFEVRNGEFQIKGRDLISNVNVNQIYEQKRFAY